MTKTLGIFGTVICSAALLALPAAAQERGNNSRNTQTYSQQSATAPVYGQTYTNQRNTTPSYGQQRNAAPSYGQRYTAPKPARAYQQSYREDDHDWRRDDHRLDRYHHERRDYDRWDWR